MAVLDEFQLKPSNYAIIIARAEPENSILEIVTAFSRKRRTIRLVVLGNYDLEKNEYHRKVRQAASDQVDFLGAIYDKEKLKSLRYFSLFYIHGHQVGGTNPSLVEAMGAGSAVLAHCNPYNKWVAGDAGVYFTNEEECSNWISELASNHELLEKLAVESKKRFNSHFTWNTILEDYLALVSEINLN